MTIKEIAIAELKEYENNPRHNENAVDAVAASISAFGFNCRVATVNNKYLITEQGDIYRLYRKGKLKIELQAKRKHSNGYLRGVIDGKDVYIHRLVATAFCNNPFGYKEVNHIDGIKENNTASNLEWCSRSQNNKHAFQTGLRDYAELSKMAKIPKLKRRKFSDEQIKEIRQSTQSDTDLSKKFNVSRGVIYQIRKNKSYKTAVMNG